MARTGIKNTWILLMKPFSVFARQNHRKTTRKELEEAVAAAANERRRSEDTAACWRPDHRTGIYYPEGQEQVMDDIPNDAASFDCTFWLRSIDGVDDHKPNNIDYMHSYPN